MPFELQCQNCKVIGELDEYIDQFECPQCHGVMLPINNQVEEEEDEDDDAPTISISRSQIADYKKKQLN